MQLEDILASFHAIILIRSFYLLSASAILFVRFVPPLRDRFLNYGARQAPQEGRSGPDTHRSSTIRLLDSLAGLKVSHSRFSDFYSLSLVCLAFWTSRIYLRWTVSKVSLASVLEMKQDCKPIRLALSFLLLAIQSLRRLYECLRLSKPSKSSSTMWVGHYLIGLAFYFFVNIAIFVDQFHSKDDSPEFKPLISDMDKIISPVDKLALLTFSIASAKQYQYHQYLASLKKYTLPDQHAFRYTVAPHYTAECLIYLSLSVISAPDGQMINKTVLSAFVFVVVNLGVTAEGTKQWMHSKFPDRRKDIEARWRMIPMIF
jgi:3-oxo-5-alpha-steroid 4-dehydrogenase 3 / polyprenol reductase